jgi:hypothetical protein
MRTEVERSNATPKRAGDSFVGLAASGDADDAEFIPLP